MLSSQQEQTMVHQLFEAAVSSFPQLKALVYGNQWLTYQELNHKADQLANVISRDIPEQEIIGLSTMRSLEMIIALIAILKSGKSYLPLDPTYPESRLQQIKEDSGVQTCICASAENPVFGKLGLKVILSTEAAEAGPEKITVQSPNVCILYTSGSTGKPKGVAIEHSGLVNFLNWAKESVLAGPGVKASQFCHLSFDASFQEIFVPLVSGGTLFLIPDEDRLDSSSLLNFLIRNEIDKAVFPYVTLQYLTEAASTENKFPTTLREVTTGGELLKISPSIRKFFSEVPDCILTNVYGPTEATIMVTCLKLSGDPELWPALPSIGKPIAGSSIFFLNEDLELLEDGETGELCIAGPCLTKGYLHRPELTAEKFINWIHPALGEIRIYRTGDLGRYLDNGEIEFRGRKDGQVKIRGNRVELPEIELAIMQQEYIRQAVVILREDTPGRKMLTAYLTGYEADEESHNLRDTLANLLPDYMIPAYFIWLEDFPKTTSGKIDQKSLPKPGSGRPDLRTIYKKATTSTEQKLTGVFQEILEYDRIGIDDNFFELGGNSLLAQKTVAALKYQHHLILPITKLYQFPTVAGIAAFIDRKPNASRKTASSVSEASKDIAVIGMAGKFPGADSIDALWEVLISGIETTSFFTEEELDPSIPAELRNDSSYVKARGIVKDADLFEPSFFGINNKLAAVMDPQQRIFLEIAWEVLEATGHLPSKYPHKIGVFAGSGNNTYYENNVLSRPDLIDALGRIQVVTVNEKDYIASRTAYHLDLKGPAVSVNSACSTSLLAIAEAVNSLHAFQCEVALAGAASITAPINSGHLYQEGSMLSADGHCRPFDQDSSGTVFSDGAGVVLLKRLDDAERDGDHIYAVIKGIGVNNDGAGKGSFTAPSTEGQADAIIQAIDDAGISASSISYIEAHGTGTPIGDPIEFDGLITAFGEQNKQQFCAIGSVKSNFGHLTHAAGVAGFIKSCLSLQHKQIPASLGYQNPNKNIDFKNSPFYVNDTLSDWESSSGKRIAGVSSFGIGGTNVHIILEEYQNKPLLSSPGRPFELIAWSADSEGSREQYASALASYLKKNPESELADVGFSLHKSRHEFRQRQFIVADSRGAATSALLDKNGGASQKNTLTELPGEVLFSFPGQGAQYLNMGLDLYQQEPVYRDAIDRCAEILKDYIGLDIRTVIFPAEVSDSANEKLRDTRYTQPALFVTEYALAQLWIYWGISPTLLCGHSIGEYVAAHLSGVFSLEDGLKLIATRGALVADLPSGSMLSVRHEVGLISEILPDGLSIAAVNSQMLCVVSGPEDQIAEFAKVLDGREIANKLLFTSHAFHSLMMDPILENFSKVVAEVPLSAPIVPIISTVTGKLLSDAEAVDPEYWTKHLRNTVKFSDAIETVLTYDHPIVLEIGPGNVTSTLIKQISTLKSVKVPVFASLNPQQKDYASVLTALGQLWSHGLQPEWPNFYSNQHRIFLTLPPYQFNKSRYWVDPVKTVQPGLYTINNLELNDTQTPNKQEPNQTLIMRKTNLTNKIKQVLEDASGIEMSNFEPNKNFLEIGLDSLLLTQVAISLKKEFNLPITFRKLNEEYPTINTLADYIDQNTAPDVDVQPVTQPVFQTAPTQNADGSVLGLIAQQIDLLSRQVALLQDSSTGARPVALPAAAPVAKPVQKQQEDIVLTEQEKAEIQKPFGATPKIERHATDLNPEQAQFLKDFTIRYNKRTQKSKEYAAESRSYMADPRVVSGFKPFTKELVYPLVINRSSGSRLWDLDGHEYIDTLNGFGSNLLGYQPEIIKQAMHDQIEKGYEVGPQHELSSQVSKLVCEFTGFDRAALCSTGSEAVLGCIRIARTVTSRSLIVAFTGSYHGVIDEVLVRGTKKLKSFPAAAGIMPEAVQNILVLDYGTSESLAIIKERASEIAAVLVEPVQSRRPEFVPVEFLKELRAITAASGTALVFDEVITGFRMHPGGAQALFGIKADIASYGKVVGAGVPIGVIAGKKEYMDALDGGNWQYGDQSFPEVGVTYFAGTFVRHPLALISAKTSLTYMKEKGPSLQQKLNDKGAYIEKTLNKIIEQRGIPMCIVNFGSLWKVKYLEEIPYSELIFALMREKGIHILDGFPCFITEATSDADIEQIITCFTESLDELIAAGFLATDKQITETSNTDAVVTYADMPPVKGARLGKDESGNPAWFIEDPDHTGKYLQVELNSKS